MEKECQICGVFFTPSRKNQKYCPACGPHSESKRMQMARNFSRSVQKYGTGRPVEPIQNVCLNCGKNFKSWIYPKKFCSPECDRNFVEKHTSCAFCKKPYLDVENPAPIGRTWFCSEECKTKTERESAKNKGLLSSCQYCGKEVIGKKFCNRACYMAAVKQGWKPEPVKIRPRYCKNCGKEFPEHYDGYCSPECRIIGQRREQRNREMYG